MFALCYLKSLSSRIRISTNHLSESIRENSGTVICIVCMVRGGSEGYGTVREGTGNCLPCWRILRNPASHSLWLEIRLVRISIQIILIRYVLIRLVRNVARMIRNRFVSSVSPSMKLAKSSTSSSLQQSAVVAQLFSFIQPFLPFFFPICNRLLACSSLFFFVIKFRGCCSTQKCSPMPATASLLKCRPFFIVIEICCIQEKYVRNG